MRSRSFRRIVRWVAAAAAAALSVITVNISPAGAAAQEFPFSGPNHGYAGATFDWTGRCTRTSCSATEDRSTYDNLSGRNPYA